MYWPYFNGHFEGLIADALLQLSVQSGVASVRNGDG